MIYYKTEEEINLLREGADILGKTHGEVFKNIKEGVSTKFLDLQAETFIKDHSAFPSFKGYNGYKYSLCISVNSVVVHGLPSDYELKSGDIVSIDCGVLYKGFHTDSAYTHAVGFVQPEVKELLNTTKESLYFGIDKAIAGYRLGDVSSAIQEYVESKKFSVVRELVGHGIGKNLHEAPEVPNYGRRGSGIKLQEGLVLAIEPMVNLGSKNIFQESDGWTIRTKDNKPSAHFEHTVVVRKDQAEILTTFKYIDQEE
ncbi:type I methionyl aminopeptidase [Adhaeribacter pallidiroseus]|uniref:Methionine aminopeptidase n=1 Tax=Adhaeribacter pallidiroseus TaxID=2072847 RepID=A0A369QK24_9BACT|nr:type I methionyl aminopeptidase [Adhaeribacter pallidiroseus]RDC64742.1 Methionyl aminopeptidase [Adhaeribacter pallidiroseus]